MTAILAIAATAAVVLAWLVVPPLLRRRRRQTRLLQPLPEATRSLIDRTVPLRRRMPPDLRARHAGLVNAFLAEKEFVGCNGLAITDEIRATIAAQACLLLLGRHGALYDELRSILVYPTAFWVEDEVEDPESGVVTKRHRALSGESWDSHRIVLSWEDIAAIDAAAASDGFNLVLHEFAHYLDAEGLGLAAPPPPPAPRRMRATEAWLDDLNDEFEQLLDAVERGEDTFLDPYGAEEAAEFFAVASEEFFERPRDLRTEHPRLYGLLFEFYGVDPATWVDKSRVTPTVR